MQTHPLQQQENIFTVSRLNNEVRGLLEKNYPFVWVEGEISNFAAPHSGHWYFSLKDANAQVRCAMFRAHQRKLACIPKDGMHVLIKAKVSLYENRGEFQLIAEDMEERGEGKLQREFEMMKKKLQAAGLFEASCKKTLPLFPKTIGIITSATGAAVRDILNVLLRRYPCAPIIIYPTLVQGASASPAIVNAIQLANRRNECDVLILARGGGSLEDLWCFNAENVAYAIFESQIPIISGVGHEIDFTIADFVADVRAPTPSAAAELITPDRQELQQLIAARELQVIHHIGNKIQALRQQIQWTHKHLSQQHPRHRLNQQMQHLDICEAKLLQQLQRLMTKCHMQIQLLTTNLHKQTPLTAITALQSKLVAQTQTLKHFSLQKLNATQSQLAQLAGKLDALSPLATLQRGYAVATRPDHHIVTNAKDVAKGEHINVKLSVGELECEVIEARVE